jgi:hypothetical protein
MDDYPLLGVFWTGLMFMFIFMWIWIVVAVFADNFRRSDHSGWAKALWTLFIVFLPVLGVVAYMISRPKMTEEELMMAGRGTQVVRSTGVSAATEIDTASQLLASGSIDQAEFAELKRRALAG